jgi:hypothetical protein
MNSGDCIAVARANKAGGPPESIKRREIFIDERK